MLFGNLDAFYGLRTEASATDKYGPGVIGIATMISALTASPFLKYN